MRLKSITKNYLIGGTRAYTNYDGSFWAICNPMVIRLPENYKLNPRLKFVSDKFIPDLLAHDQKSDRQMMDLDTEVESWRPMLKDYHHVELYIPLGEDVFECAYNSKYVKMFNWHTDARYSVNLSTGLMYVTESIVGTLMGIILPIKLRGR